MLNLEHNVPKMCIIIIIIIIYSFNLCGLNLIFKSSAMWMIDVTINIRA